MSSVYWQPRTKLIWAITSKIALTSQVSTTQTPTLLPPSPPLFLTGRLQGHFAIGSLGVVSSSLRIAFKSLTFPTTLLLIYSSYVTFFELLCDSCLETTKLTQYDRLQNFLTGKCADCNLIHNCINYIYWHFKISRWFSLNFNAIFLHILVPIFRFQLHEFL